MVDDRVEPAVGRAEGLVAVGGVPVGQRDEVVERGLPGLRGDSPNGASVRRAWARQARAAVGGSIRRSARWKKWCTASKP